MKNKAILLFLILLGLVLIVFVSLQLPNRIKTQSQIQEKSNSTVSYETKIDEKGEVIVEATPTKLSSEENSEFTIKFTTHSIELNYDIKNIALLTDDKGSQYKPLSWTGEKGGHHAEGVLTFSELSEKAKKITLTIPNIDGQDRVFSWGIK